MILVFLIGLALLEISLIGFLLWKMHELVAQRKSTHGEIQRAESALRDEFSRNRDEGANRFHELRQEVATALLTTHHAVTQTLSDLPVAQQNQFELFGKRLSDFIRSSDQKLDALRSALESSLNTLIQSNEQKQETLRSTLEAQLNRLRQENDAKLEQMRQTVDEKLQGALEKRLGESFNLVAERLELVHKGLGEMQNLATGVGDLKKVLSNIRARGTCGEVQLEMLLEQMLSPQQYARNVLVRDDSGERVEFAVRLPGRGEAGEVLLPIDAKFPQEDYQRLVEAQERADTDGIAHCTSKLEDQIKRCARDVYEKYINPPRTTDFAILFVPTEGLFAEIIRRPGLIESLQQQYHVTVAGPTTLAALLCSLQKKAAPDVFGSAVRIPMMPKGVEHSLQPFSHNTIRPSNPSAVNALCCLLSDVR
ncbi:MAG TPA: DNA recombination protein RmuC [Acidobacteriota bacterium]